MPTRDNIEYRDILFHDNRDSIIRILPKTILLDSIYKNVLICFDVASEFFSPDVPFV